MIKKCLYACTVGSLFFANSFAGEPSILDELYFYKKVNSYLTKEHYLEFEKSLNNETLQTAITVVNNTFQIQTIKKSDVLVDEDDRPSESVMDFFSSLSKTSHKPCVNSPIISKMIEIKVNRTRTCKQVTSSPYYREFKIISRKNFHESYYTDTNSKRKKKKNRPPFSNLYKKLKDTSD